MSRQTQPPTSRQPTTTRVQSLLIRLDGITAGDYLAWVRDPEPPALDHWLRSVVTSAQPLGDLISTELVWTCQPPTTPSAAAIAAGFPLTPEVIEVIDTTIASLPSIRIPRGCRTPQLTRSGGRVRFDR